MKKKDTGTKTIQELKKELNEGMSILYDLRLEKSQSKLKNVRSIFHKRKEIARLKTKIREIELAKSKDAKGEKDAKSF